MKLNKWIALLTSFSLLRLAVWLVYILITFARSYIAHLFRP